MNVLGPAPWIDAHTSQPNANHSSVEHLHKQQAAALGIALLLEEEPGRSDDDYLRECVRSSLISWQLSLRGDGWPLIRSWRRSPLHGPMTAMVVQLLSDTTGFQTDLLFSDLEAHIRWVGNQRRQAPWIEAATIAMLADAVVLLRDRAWERLARQRLEALLAKQDSEGWFPEQGGADPGRLSMTLDALARLYTLYRWDDLHEPLQRTLRFMLHFVHPDGSYGGCYGSCGTAMLSPYGVELLAGTFPEAAALAHVCRLRYENAAEQRFSCWSEESCAIIGSRLALAAANTASAPSPPTPLPHETISHFRFPNAGLSIFNNDSYFAVVGERNGGAMRVTWREKTSTLDDPGVTVVFPHKIRTSRRYDRRVESRVTEQTLTCHGILRKPQRAPAGKHLAMKQILYAVVSKYWHWRKKPRVQKDYPSRRDLHRLTHDWFRRDITFGQDSIRIRDVVDCRLRARAVLYQSPAISDALCLVDHQYTGQGVHAPIFLEGARHVQLIRVYANGDLIERTAKRRLALHREQM